MTGRLATRYPRPATPPAAADPAQLRCDRGGLDAVINGSDLATAAAHLSGCMSCQAQFLSQGGLLPVPGRATGDHAIEERAASKRSTGPGAGEAAGHGAPALP